MVWCGVVSCRVVSMWSFRFESCQTDLHSIKDARLHSETMLRTLQEELSVSVDALRSASTLRAPEPEPKLKRSRNSNGDVAAAFTGEFVSRIRMKLYFGILKRHRERQYNHSMLALHLCFCLPTSVTCICVCLLWYSFHHMQPATMASPLEKEVENLGPPISLHHW